MFSLQAFSEAGLSPGDHTKKYAAKRMIAREKQSAKSALPSTKRRRLILKQERASFQGTQEVLEGATYQSGMNLGFRIQL